MDGCSRQNPAYRPASERAPDDGSPLHLLPRSRSPRDLNARYPFREMSLSRPHASRSATSPATTSTASPIGPDLILDATERALAAQGHGEVVLEPREHLVPDPAFDGHFNLLRAYVAPLDVAGVKVVGDYHGNYKLGLPSELALLTLYDPRTGVPRAIIDATAITEWRTGAVTALGGRHLARARREGARPRRRARHRVRQRDAARPRARLRRDPRHERAAGVARGVRRSGCARRSASRSRVVRHDRGDGDAAPTSSSRRRGSPRRSRSCAPSGSRPPRSSCPTGR